MQTRFTKRYVRALAAVIFVAVWGFETGGAQAAAGVAATRCGIDMRVLVIAATGSEADLPAIITTLDYLGTPYTLHVAGNAPGALTADRLSSGCHANYQAVIT